MRYLPLLLLFIGSPLLADGEVYTWVDAQGQRHFGDRPPATADAERLEYLEPDPDAPPPPPPKPLKFHYQPPKHSSHHSSAPSARDRREQRCEKFREQLDALRERMREGYTLKQSAGLRQREQRYKQGIFDNCR